MSGILTEVYWFLLTTFYSIGALTELPFVLTTIQGPGKPSCFFLEPVSTVSYFTCRFLSLLLHCKMVPAALETKRRQLLC